LAFKSVYGHGRGSPHSHTNAGLPTYGSQARRCLNCERRADTDELPAFKNWNEATADTFLLLQDAGVFPRPQITCQPCQANRAQRKHILINLQRQPVESRVPLAIVQRPLALFQDRLVGLHFVHATRQ